MVYVYHSLKNRRETHMMGHEETEVCSSPKSKMHVLAVVGAWWEDSVTSDVWVMGFL